MKMRYCLFLLLYIRCFLSSSQLLQVPVRPSDALKGSEAVATMSPLPIMQREEFILNEILNGNIPDFYREMIEINDSTEINGTYKHIKYYVIPDYLALGSDDDYFLCPMTPLLGQRLADSTDCLLPTRKMVDKIWYQATIKMDPQPISPTDTMTFVSVFANHNQMVWEQRQSFFPDMPLGSLVSGNKKDIVLSNLIHTSSPPQRVVIYGWHYTTGSPIQPLYAGHNNTYVDYSHGVRLVQNKVWVNSVSMLATDVLASDTLYSLLSDEGQINRPFYPDSTQNVSPNPLPPLSFAVLRAGKNSIKIILKDDHDVDIHKLLTSSDGASFTEAIEFSGSTYTLDGLTSDEVVYVRLIAKNSNGESTASEVLASVPSEETDTILIVNGFDRATIGNTHDFMRQHATAITEFTTSFSSATNNAILDGLLDLNDYKVVDYILGEESTADETFDYNEQQKIKVFLNNGGSLFVSGAEIGWDLHHKGSGSDRNFYANYLKANYVKDAPNNESGKYYGFEQVGEESPFTGFMSAYYDNGTHGTYNVKYPDVIKAVNGSKVGLQYAGLTSEYAAIYFNGLFPESTTPGKLVYLAFPFETVYPENKNKELMTQILDFFSKNEKGSEEPLTITETNELVAYPNPFDSVLYVKIESNKAGRIKLFDMHGNLLLDVFTDQKVNVIDTKDLSSGMYELLLDVDSKSRRMKLIKK
jgi:hypothetical protein